MESLKTVSSKSVQTEIVVVIGLELDWFDFKVIEHLNLIEAELIHNVYFTLQNWPSLTMTRFGLNQTGINRTTCKALP